MRRKLILRLLGILFLFSVSAAAALAQKKSKDSVDVTIPSPQSIIQQASQKADSVSDRIHSLHRGYQDKLSKLDSAQQQLRQNNILYPSGQKIDSIQSAFYQRSDSLKNAYKRKLEKLGSSQANLRRKLDSLTTLKLPADKISQKLDSLAKLGENTSADFEKKLQSIKDQASSKLKKLDLPPEASDKVNSITKSIEEIKLPPTELNIPSLDRSANLLGTDGGKLNDLANINIDNPLESGGVTEKMKIPDGVEGVKALSNAQEIVSGVSNITEQAKEYSKEAQQLAKGNLDEAENISKVVEEKATQVSGINEIEKQTEGLEEYKAMTTKAQDPEALRKEAMEKAKQVAVNHFAGKEEQLKAAMEKISKYKQKYSSLDGVSELSKKRPNELRNKTLIERIVPGIAIQFQKDDGNMLVDFNPYAGYRFSGKLRAGLGWNQRIGYNVKQYRFNPGTRVYGPRAFGEFTIGNGFSPRAEIEIMNTGIPSFPLTTYDPDRREWVWGAFVGIKKEYKIVKNVKGTAMIMTRLFNPQHKSPYADVLNVRFGFEFPLKKKVNNKK